MVSIGWWVRTTLLPIVEPYFAAKASPRKPRLVEWKERDDWIVICVRMGLNAREISNLSYSWPRPISTVRQVYDKIEQLNLKRAYKTAQKKKRVGLHNENMIYAFSKLTGQALEHGFRVRDVMRDSAPEGMRFRFDLQIRINQFLFFVEVQLSKIEGTRWGEKFRNYIRLYESLGQPFRCLVLVDKREDIAKIRRMARNQLRKMGHPNLNLFLFMTLDQFRNAPDVVKGPVWSTVWSNKPVALV